MRRTVIGLMMLSLVGCSGLAITDEDSGAMQTGKVAARVLLAIPTFGMSEAHLGFEAQRRQREWEDQQYRRWVESLPPEQQERERDRQARLDAAALQAWGLYSLSQPFRHAPVQGDQPPLQCQTLGTNIYAQTICR